MNEKKLKDLLNKELSSKVPELDDRILSTPIAKQEEQNVDVEFNFNAKEKFISLLKSRKVWTYTAAIACVLIVAILAVIYVSGFVSGKEDNKEVYSCYVVDINPSVSVTTDSKGNIISMSSVNGDGDLVLSNNEVANSKTIDEWLNNVISAATAMGYIDASSKENAVKISAINSDGTSMDGALLEKKEVVLSSLLGNGIYGIVITQQSDKESFNNRFNVSASSEKDFINATKDRPVYNYEQGDINAKINQLKTENIKGCLNNIKTIVKDLTAAYVRFNEIDLEINKLYDDEKKGYFYAKTDAKRSEEISSLVSEGDAILEKLKEYDCVITEEMTIKLFFDSQLGFYADKLTVLNEYVQGVDFDSFNLGIIEELTMDALGEDKIITTQIESMNLYENMDEEKFFDFEKSSIKELINSRVDNYKEINAEKREKISANTYDDYLNSIVEKYGSLENYYEFLKNHQ